MNLLWYGHAAFRLDGGTPETRVVLDPYRAPDVGTYAPIDDGADAVAVSHENQKYHSFVEGISGRAPGERPTVIDGLTLFDNPPLMIGAARFSAVRVWENEQKREPIAMLIVEMDGVRVLHMGDCGHALTDADVANCGRVDVLLALAGGPPTLALSDLVDFIARLEPRVVVPMHFGNDKINLNLRPVSDLLAFYPPESVQRFDRPTVDISNDALPGENDGPHIWVLPPAR